MLQYKPLKPDERIYVQVDVVIFGSDDGLSPMRHQAIN